MEEEKTKKCPACKKEFPATSEYFGKRTLSPDGFGYRCKKCQRDYVKDYRKGGEKGVGKTKKDKPPVTRSLGKEPLSVASPEAIIAALRKGVAREIIQFIEERFQ